MKKKYTKGFYNFLVQEGIMFQFLDLIKTTSYKTLKVHCERNKPMLYILNCYLRNDNIYGTWDTVWKPINERWIEHLRMNLYKMKK